MALYSTNTVYLVVANIAREFIDRGRLEEFAQLVYDNRHIFPARDFASAVAQYDDPSDYAYDELKEDPREALQWVEFALDQLGDTVLIYPMQRDEEKYAATWKYWTWEDDDMQFRVAVDVPIMFGATDMVAWNRLLPLFRFQVGVLRKDALDYWEAWKKLQSSSRWVTLHDGDVRVLERAWTKAAMQLKSTRDVLVGDLLARLRRVYVRMDAAEAAIDGSNAQDPAMESHPAQPEPGPANFAPNLPVVERASTTSEDLIMADIQNREAQIEAVKEATVVRAASPKTVSVAAVLNPEPAPVVVTLQNPVTPVDAAAAPSRPSLDPIEPIHAPIPLAPQSTGFQFIPASPALAVPTPLNQPAPRADDGSGGGKKRKLDAISVGSAETSGPPSPKRAKTEGVLSGRDVFQALRSLLNEDVVHTYLRMSDTPDVEQLVMNTPLGILHSGSENVTEIVRLLPQARATMAIWQAKIIAFGSRTDRHVPAPKPHRITPEENTLALFKLYMEQIVVAVDQFFAQWPQLAECIFNRGDTSAMTSFADNMAMKNVIACREALDWLDILLESAKLRFGAIVRKIGTILFHTHRLVNVEYKALVNDASVVTKSVREMEQEFGKI